MRDTMGDRRRHYPEILGRLEQVLSVEPSLDHDISWLLARPATLWFTRHRRDVESLLWAKLPLAVWSIDLEPAIDAKLRVHPGALWHRAWRAPMDAIKSDAIALSLAFLRSMGDPGLVLRYRGSSPSEPPR